MISHSSDEIKFCLTIVIQFEENMEYIPNLATLKRKKVTETALRFRLI